MGNAHAAGFAGVFEVLNKTTLADVAGYLEKFRGSDQDFGISAEGLHAITGFGASEVAAIVKGLSPKGTGVINALEFISGAAVLVQGSSISERLQLVFNAVDFDSLGVISNEELVIALISVLTGVTKMTGKGSCPNDAFLEGLTNASFKSAGKSLTEKITFAETKAFVLSQLHISEDGAITVDDLLKKFQCVPEGAAAAAAETDEFLIPIAHEFPTFPAESNSLLKQHLSHGVYEALKDKRTPLGVTLYDIIKVGVQNPICKLGVMALDHDSYTEFSALMDPVIEGYHRGYKLSEGHRRDLDPAHLGDAAQNPDPTGEFIDSTRIRVARNLRGFPLPGKNTTEQRRQIETLVVAALNSLTGDLAGTYYSLENMTPAVRVQLEKDHFLFRKEHGYFAFGGIYRDWPEGRGIFHNPAKTFLVWVNEEDELRIISMQPGGNIGEVFSRLSRAIHALESKLDVIFDDKRGFIASCPSNLGTGMRASVHIKVPLASKDPRFKAICDELHLQPRGADGEHSEANDVGLWDISPLKRLGLTEVDCARALYNGAVRLIALEKELRAEKEASK